MIQDPKNLLDLLHSLTQTSGGQIEIAWTTCDATHKDINHTIHLYIRNGRAIPSSDTNRTSAFGFQAGVRVIDGWTGKEFVGRGIPNIPNIFFPMDMSEDDFDTTLVHFTTLPCASSYNMEVSMTQLGGITVNVYDYDIHTVSSYEASTHKSFSWDACLFHTPRAFPFDDACPHNTPELWQ